MLNKELLNTNDESWWTHRTKSHHEGQRAESAQHSFLAWLWKLIVLEVMRQHRDAVLLDCFCKPGKILGNVVKNCCQGSWAWHESSRMLLTNEDFEVSHLLHDMTFWMKFQHYADVLWLGSFMLSAFECYDTLQKLPCGAPALNFFNPSAMTGAKRGQPEVEGSA